MSRGYKISEIPCPFCQEYGAEIVDSQFFFGTPYPIM